MSEKTHPCAYFYKGWCNEINASGATHFDVFNGVATCGFMHEKDKSKMTCDSLQVAPSPSKPIAEEPKN